MTDHELLRDKLLGSFLLFTRTFYKLRTGREFVISQPICRESHHITIAKNLTKVFKGEITHDIIAIPPRYSKTELAISWVAWTLAHYPDSNFLYISYSHTLAKKQTQTIRDIINLREYKEMFGVELAEDTSAKDNFKTTAGGSVYAAGAGGTITGQGAGIQLCKRFGGAIIIDDIHKPSEITSDTMRERDKDWFKNTLQSRVNSPNTPIVCIGQRLHEDDLTANLINGFDGNKWETVILPAIGSNGQSLNPAMHTIEKLHVMQETMPYEFAAQYQQNPQPAGGGIFKEEDFIILPQDPDMLATFFTVDTAETAKTYNDATVFSFLGIYKIQNKNVVTDILGLHIIDCEEIWVEPKDLEGAWDEFYARAMTYPIKPTLAGIERKSTGVTLSNILAQKRGLKIHELFPKGRSESKTQRFLQIQPFIASRRISLTLGAHHTDHVIKHMGKITANDSHRNDDIADTIAYGVQMALIDNIVTPIYNLDKTDPVGQAFSNHYQRMAKTRFTTWRTT